MIGQIPLSAYYLYFVFSHPFSLYLRNPRIIELLIDWTALFVSLLTMYNIGIKHNNITQKHIDKMALVTEIS